MKPKKRLLPHVLKKFIELFLVADDSFCSDQDLGNTIQAFVWVSLQVPTLTTSVLRCTRKSSDLLLHRPLYLFPPANVFSPVGYMMLASLAPGISSLSAILACDVQSRSHQLISLILKLLRRPLNIPMSSVQILTLCADIIALFQSYKSYFRSFTVSSI